MEQKYLKINHIKYNVPSTVGDDIAYDRIPLHLKRYSFSEKMRICAKYSRMTFDSNGDIDANKLYNLIYPWELETFLLHSITASPEYQQGNFLGKNENQFIKMINGIRNYQHPALKKYEGKLEFVDFFFSATGLMQFDIQETKHYKMFRYAYIFNFENDIINMKEEFRKFYGTTYEDFLELGSFLTLIYGSEIDLTANVIGYVANNIYNKATRCLLIDEKHYKAELNKITKNYEDYISCLRPSYKYPFILKENVLYLPLPHLILRSVTSSLLFRLTEGNNDLRDKFGKEVLESYLLKIMRESEAYDEVYGEKPFVKEHGNRAKTLDVMVRDKEEYVLLDSKAAVPSIGLRTYNEMAFKKELEKMIDKVVQIYKHLKQFLPNYPSYNPFIGAPSITDEHLWGISVLLEDNYIRRGLIYEEASQRLDIIVGSEEYDWMVKHIKITSLYDIERYSLTGRSLERQEQ